MNYGLSFASKIDNHVKSKTTPRTKMQSAEPAVLASFWWDKNSANHQRFATPNKEFYKFNELLSLFQIPP